MQISIPSVACGEPCVKKIEVDTNYDHFAVYRESNLEKNYTWQPHFGVNVGLAFDFVDQDALVNKSTESNQIDTMDHQFIQHVARKGDKAKLIGGDTWWLRNPVYLENNLYELTNNFKANMATEAREMRAKLNDQGGELAAAVNQNIFSAESADKSFDDVVAFENQMRASAVGVEYSVPILPHAEASSCSYSTVKFDLDPLAANMEEEQLSYAQQDPVELARKRARMRYSVGTNSRSLDDAGHKASGIAPAKSNVFAISIVAPRLKDSDVAAAEDDEEDEEDDLFGDDSDDEDAAAAAAKVKAKEQKAAGKKRGSGEISGALELELEEPYTWVKDFKTEVRNKSLRDTFALFIDSAGDGARAAHYLPLRSQMIMSKLPYVNKQSLPVPQEVLLSRTTK
jgi:hypothetical protein